MKKEENVFVREVSTLYSNAKPRYSEKELKEIYADNFIVAFVDILGFRSMIENDPRGEKFIPLINDAIKSALHFTDAVRNFGNSSELEYRIFSDNICFWMPMKYHTLSISMMFSILSEFQLGLVSNGILCRGGVALGYHYANEHVLYGPALVESVKLEHSTTFPCISISNKIIEDVLLIGMPLQLHMYHKLTTEGTWFINYLSKIFYIEKEKSMEIVEHHRNIISKNIENFSEDPKILEKYMWVGSYHNNIVSMIKFKDECVTIAID